MGVWIKNGACYAEVPRGDYLPEYTYEQFKQLEHFTHFPDDLIKSHWELYHSDSYLPGGGEYEGERQGNQRHGWGRCTYRNGNVYEGEWRNGLRNGPGTYYYANGDRFEGQIIPVVTEGITHKWGLTAKHGKGILHKADGSIFECMWKEGLKHGTERRHYADGTRFEAEWKAIESDDEDDLRQELGEFTWFFPNGDRFEGRSDKDNRKRAERRLSLAQVHPGWEQVAIEDGKPIYRPINDFAWWAPDDTGIYYYSNGDKIEFEDCTSWRGEGTLTCTNGDIFWGRWSDGLRNGRGEWSYRCGNRFEGNYKDGKRFGEGTFHTKNGDTITSRYKKDGKPDRRTRNGADGNHGDWIEPLWPNLPFD